MSSPNSKDTIYIDVDDEITTVIDKVQSSDKNIVALVLPKRPGAFQSVVNMKLLKKTADNTQKNVVLISKDKSLLPLAGAVGMYTAPDLQSKPTIPDSPKSAADSVDKNKTVGELSEETKDDEVKVESQESDKPDKKSGKKKSESKDKTKIPNFERFRKRLLIGGLAALLLIGGAVYAFMVLPKATVALTTNTSNVDVNLNFTADTEASEFDEENSVVPAVRKDFRETDSERVAATGEKNLGNKAEGSVELTNCAETTGAINVPAGTRVVNGNLAYVTDESVNLPESSFNFFGDCTTSSRDVDVTAEQAGEEYNLSSGKNFNLSGYNGVEAVNEDNFSGGTTKIVKIVSQGDVDGALQKIQDRANSDASEEIVDELRDDGFYPIKATLSSEDPVITTSPNVGDESNNVTVTATTSYTMVGVQERFLRRLINNEAQKDIDSESQQINEYSLNKAEINLRDADSSSENLPLSLSISLVAGPEINKNQIKNLSAGKSKDDIKRSLGSRPGISEVEVTYSPFWVSSTPKSADKINVRVSNSSDE